MSEAYNSLKKIFSNWSENYYAIDVLQARKWMAAGAELDDIVDQIIKLRIEQKSLLGSEKVSSLIVQAEKESLTSDQTANLREMKRWVAHSSGPSEDIIRKLELVMKSSEAKWLEGFDYAQAHGNKRAWLDIVKPALKEVFSLRRQYAREISAVLKCKPSEVTLDEWNPHLRNQDIAVSAREARENNLFRSKFEEVRLYFDRKPMPLPVNFDPKIFNDDSVLAFAEKMIEAFIDAMKLSPEERQALKIKTGLMDNAYCWGRPDDITIVFQHQNTQTFLHTIANIMHECGHMTYLIETGRSSNKNRDQPVGMLNGYGTHELAAMFFDQLAHKRQFFAVLGPMICEHFKVSGPEWSDANLYELMTRPQFDNLEWGSSELALFPNILWRVEAEQAILDSETEEEFEQAIDSLPERWASTMKELTGVEHNPEDFCIDANHWFDRQTGYFWAYVFGGQVASYMHNDFEPQQKKDHPFNSVSAPVNAMSEFLAPYVKEITEKVYRFQSKHTPQELATRITRGRLSIGEYVNNRYSYAFPEEISNEINHEITP